MNTLAPMGVLLLRHTGMRIGELVDLDRDALQYVAGQYVLRVPIGKTNEERIIPVTEETAEWVAAIKAQRGSQLNVNRGGRWPRRLRRSVARYLMVNPSGQHVSAHAYRFVLERYLQHLAPLERIHLHRFRHTYATEMARAGMNIQTLMTILGHASPRMTMRYVHLAAEDIQREYHRAINKIELLDSLVPGQPSVVMATSGQISASPEAVITHLIELFDTMRHEQTNEEAVRQLDRFKKRLWRTRADFKKFQQDTQS